MSLPVIQTAHLFPVLDDLLINLLNDLSIDDWHRPTLSPEWCVKDIAAHLLDGNIRALSTHRDSYFGEKPEKQDNYQDLLNFLNRLNADWVRAMKRVSPRALIDLLRHTGRQYNELMASLPPMEKTLFSVAWAGETESLNWFHVAREYTEKWHHQQQIRHAVGQEEPLFTMQLYKPFLDTSMRAVPYHYRSISSREGDSIHIEIQASEAIFYQLQFSNSSWHLSNKQFHDPAAELIISGKIAWRIFCKQLSKEEALSGCKIEGDHRLAEHFFTTVAIMG